MNVLYTTVDNPITVAVAGYQGDVVSISMSGGTITAVNKKAGEYTVMPDLDQAGKEVYINIKVRKPNGGTETMGKVLFTVNNVPKPELRHIDSDKASVAQISNTSITTKMPEWFVFKGVKFRVKSFDIELVGTIRYQKTGISSISGEVLTELNRLKKGDKVIINNIVVKQQGGPSLPMGPGFGFSYTIK